MMFIWPKNQGNFEGVAGSTSQKFSAVIRPNKPWPSRVAVKIVARVVAMALCRMGYIAAISPSESTIFTSNAMPWNLLTVPNARRFAGKDAVTGLLAVP